MNILYNDDLNINDKSIDIYNWMWENDKYFIKLLSINGCKWIGDQIYIQLSNAHKYDIIENWKKKTYVIEHVYENLLNYKNDFNNLSEMLNYNIKITMWFSHYSKLLRKLSLLLCIKHNDRKLLS